MNDTYSILNICARAYTVRAHAPPMPPNCNWPVIQAADIDMHMPCCADRIDTLMNMCMQDAVHAYAHCYITNTERVRHLFSSHHPSDVPAVFFVFKCNLLRLPESSFICRVLLPKRAAALVPASASASYTSALPSASVLMNEYSQHV